MTEPVHPRLAVALPPNRVPEVIDAQGHALISERFRPVWADDTFPTDLDRLIAGADVVLTSWGTPKLDTAALLGGERPAVVAHAAGTVKRLVDLEAIEAGVTVFSGAGRIAWSVGEYCLGAILTLSRRLPTFDADLRAGAWKQPGTAGSELRGRRVGLVGASSTARALITLLQPFGCEIVVYDPYLTADRAAALGVRAAPLLEVMASEIVSLHVPNVPETEGMIGPEQLAALPEGAILVNSARAASLDYPAVVAAARAGRLRAALDVFDVEPLKPPADWVDCPNLLLTPHVAGDTVEGRRALAGYVLADALAWLDHGTRGPSFVDPAVWSIAA